MAVLNGSPVNSFPTPVAAAAAPAVALSGAAKDSKAMNQTFDQFLLLLTTQLKNQDPMSPMDSSEFTSQLVSFSQVEQQIKTNDSLTKLLTVNTNTQTTLGLSYIGLNVDMNGNLFKYNGNGAPARMTYNLPANAAINSVSIVNENNDVVYSQPGKLSAGKHSLIWNGLDQNGQPLPAGMYQLRVGALDAEQKNITVTTTVPGRVEGIQSGDNGDIMLIINDQEVPMAAIQRATL